MSCDFDPYHEWLGIPPRDQPANHYRLLELKLFESDREIIARAAERQTARVESARSGQHSRAATTLLEQLADARRCLLDAEKKKLYDEGLRDGQKSEWKRKYPAAVRGNLAIEDRKHSVSIAKQAASARRVRHPDKSLAGQASSVKTKPASIVTRAKKQAGTRRHQWKLVGVISGVSVAVLAIALAIFLPPADPDRPPATPPPHSSESTARQAAPPDTQATDSTQNDGSATAARELASEPATREPVLDHAASRYKQQAQRKPLDEPSLAASRPTDSQNGGAMFAESVEEFPYDGMVLWLDAADEERIEVDEDLRVESWYDGSEVENHAMAGEVRPLHVPISGQLALLRFSGAQSMTIDEAAAFNVTDYSIMLVARGDTGVLLDKGDGYNERAFSFWNGVTSIRTHRRTLQSGAPPSTRLQVHSLIAAGQRIRWRVDRTLRREIGGAHTIDNDAPLLIGRRVKESDPRYFVGDLAELLIYDRALPDGEMHAVESYLSDKWSPVSDDVAAVGTETEGMARTASQLEVVEHAVSDESLPAPRGAILREVWLGVPGSSVEDLVGYVAEHPDPDEREEIARLEPPEDYADNYGQRLTGYLHPPQTGVYEFSVRANAGGLIYISPAEQQSKRLIEPGKPINLQGDAAYHVEVYHKESTGRDYLSVGWKLPDGTDESPISGERLSVEYRVAPRHRTQFIPLRLLSAETSSGSRLAADDDGQIVVTAAAIQQDSYRLVMQPVMKHLTALRLEALPNEELPASGPGLGAGGRFALDSIAVRMIPDGAASQERELEFRHIVGSDGSDLMRLADTDAPPWRVRGRGDMASATFFLGEPVSVAGAKLLVTIENHEPLGSFRVSATSAPDPRRLGVPAGSATDEFALHVNLGGKTHTTPDGVVWKRSNRFDNQTFGHEAGRSVQQDDTQNPVQGSAVRGIQAFRAIVPDGRYEVTLYFCEYWSTQSTARQFSIAAEQRVVARNMDLLNAAGGFGRPLSYPIRNVAVMDGRLDIEFQASHPASSAILNAIRIRRSHLRPSKAAR